MEQYQSGAWVCVENPTNEEIDQLVDRFKLDPGHLEDALDADEMPRLEKEGDLTYIFVRYAYTDENLELTTSPVGPNPWPTDQGIGLRSEAGSLVATASGNTIRKARAGRDVGPRGHQQRAYLQ